MKRVTYHAYTDSQHTLILNLGSSPWKPLNERRNLWAGFRGQKIVTDLCRYHFRTSEDLWKVEERQNDTAVVVRGCGITTRWLSNSDELHKKYNQTDATRQEHWQGVQPTVAVSPTCSFGNPKDTYYMNFSLFWVPTQFISNVATCSMADSDHWQLTDFDNRFSQCCMLWALPSLKSCTLWLTYYLPLVIGCPNFHWASGHDTRSNEHEKAAN